MRKASARQTCGKTSYRTWRDADKARGRAEMRAGFPLRIYHHAPCGSYHLSSETLAEHERKYL